MAYLTVKLNKGDYDPVTNSTYVSAVVYITWDTSESYNQEHGTGTLTIGDYTTTFSTDFNASRTESGTQILGGGSTVIKHDGDNDSVQFVVNASGDGRSASAIATLSGGISSGGSSDSGSGGGSEGDSGDSGSGESSEGYVSWMDGTNQSLNSCVINIEQKEHTAIRVVVVDGGETMLNGTVLSDGYVVEWVDGDAPTLQILYEVDNGYTINEHTINGKTFNSGVEILVNVAVLTVKTSAIELDSSCVCIEDGFGFEKYNCYIDNGTSWDKYVPYIAVENYYSWDGLFEATVNTPGTGLYLRSDKSASFSNLVLMPNGAKLTVEDIAISDDGTTILAKTSYNSQTGWANTKYLTYTIYTQVTNPDGEPLYIFSTENVFEGSDTFQYGSEIVISDYDGQTDDILVIYDDAIWGFTVFKGLFEDGSTYNIYGRIKMSNVEIVSERKVLEWVALAHETESVKYLYKDGVMYSPLSDGFTTSGCTVSNVNNTLRYGVDYNYRNYKTKAIVKTAINLSGFKYLCVKVGEICETSTVAGRSLISSQDSAVYGASSNNSFFIGLNNGGSDIALNYAMCLTSSDSNGSYYVDLTSVDLFGDYYLGFGTEEIGSTAYSYIKELWLCNEIDSSLSYKSFNNILQNQGTVG